MVITVLIYLYGKGGHMDRFWDRLSLILVIIGAVNWGLIGLLRFDLVAMIFGSQSAVMSRIVYGLVGLAGLWCITLLFRDHRSEHHVEDHDRHRAQEI